MINTRITVQLTGSAELDKNANFALASALTLTAKEIQAQVIKDIESSFSVRSNWDKPSNVYGVRVKPATKADLTAWVGTAADWMEKFIEEPAGAIVIKTPSGTEYLAIPTKNVRRTKRDIIAKAQRPRAIIGKRDFVILTKRGVRVLFQRRGRGKSSFLVAMYFLVPRARIREKDWLEGPTEKVFAKRFEPILSEQLAKAYATAK
jgi:hypothetical protein